MTGRSRAASWELWRPPAGTFLSAYGEFLMAADTPESGEPRLDALHDAHNAGGL